MQRGRSSSYYPDSEDLELNEDVYDIDVYPALEALLYTVVNDVRSLVILDQEERQ